MYNVISASIIGTNSAAENCIENKVYLIYYYNRIGNSLSIENLDIHYAQSAISTPSDIPFTKDAIQSEATPNIETVIIDDIDLELLKNHRKTGSILNWEDKRTDLYDIIYKK